MFQPPRFRCPHLHFHHRGHVVRAGELRRIPGVRALHQVQAPAVCQRDRPSHVLAGQLCVGHGKNYYDFRRILSVRTLHQVQTSTVRQRDRPSHVLAGQLCVGHGKN